MSDPIGQPIGHVHWSVGEEISDTELENMGLMHERFVLHVLAQLFRDNFVDTPITGFLGNGFKVSVTGLTGTVQEGFGCRYNAAETSVWGTHYQPLWLTTDTSFAVTAHDATNPRVDLVYFSPATSDDQASADRIKDPTAGSISASTPNKRRVWAGSVSYLAGTPAASPSAPATPSGSVALAELYVPAGSGDVEVWDRRPILRPGRVLPCDPPDEYAADHVVSGIDATDLGGGVVETDEGIAVVSGKRSRYVRTAWSTPTPSTDTRIDIIYIGTAGVMTKQAGTEGAGVPAYTGLGLWQITITTAGAITLTDLRVMEPYGTDQLQDESVTSSKLADDIEIRGNLTTKRGVSGSSELEVGGLFYAATADSVVLTNTTTETALYAPTLPANMLKAGTRVRVRAVVEFVAAVVGASPSFRIRMGGLTGRVLYGANVAVATGQIHVIDVEFVMRTAGASGTWVASGEQRYAGSGGGAGTYAYLDWRNDSDEGTIDTTASHALALALAWDTADAGNQLKAKSMTVYIDG